MQSPCEIFGLSAKKRKKDDDVDYYDPVTHAIDPVALRAGYKSKLEMQHTKVEVNKKQNPHKEFNKDL